MLYINNIYIPRSNQLFLFVEQIFDGLWMKKLAERFLSRVPLVESPFFCIDAPSVLNKFEMLVAENLHKNGFAVIDFPDPDLFKKIDEIKSDLDPVCDWSSWRENKVAGLRIQDAWQTNENVKSIAANEEIIQLLSSLYMRRAIPFKTLNFPVGAEQDLHSDHAHISSAPERFMCGVWVAFEDIDEANGPLFYYPGSHRWPSLLNEFFEQSPDSIQDPYPNFDRYENAWKQLAIAENVKKEKFLAKKGQALIWSSNLVRGSSPHLNKEITGWSQVTHYCFEGCDYTTSGANQIYQEKGIFRDIAEAGSENSLRNRMKNRPVNQNFTICANLDYDVSSCNTSEALIRKILFSNYRDRAEIRQDFRPFGYLKNNIDVFKTGIDPYEHYIIYGKAEGRRYK